MTTDRPQLVRLRQILDDGTPSTKWCDDLRAQSALTSQWRLAMHVATGDENIRQKHAQNLEDSAESEKRVRIDHAGRFPIELLQNAQDACADAGIRGKAWFRVTPEALLVGNQGIPFDADRIGSLVRLGGSTKKPGDPTHHTIGYKGIGFTSVFEISDRPQVISDGVAFALDCELAKEELSAILGRLVNRAPTRYFPFPLAPSDWVNDAAEVAALRSAGAVTVIRLPFREGVTPEDVRKLLLDVLTTRTLLLMPALNGLDAGNGLHWTKHLGHKIAGAQVHHIRGDGNVRHSWLVAQSQVPISSESVEALGDEVWSDVRDLHVLVAVPWASGRPALHLEDLPTLHAYFPTDDTVGRGILIHGDFYLDSSRRHILDRGAGGKISEVVAHGAISLLGDLAERYCAERPKRMPDFLACLARQENPQGYGQDLSALLDQELAQRPILRTIRGDSVAPCRSRLVGATMPLQAHGDLGLMLQDVDRFLEPTFERSACEWLLDLGAEKLTVQQVAEAADPGRAPSYSRAVLAVASWWRGESRWSQRATLRGMRLLQSTQGGWYRARDLCKPVDGAPPLPPGLEKRAYRPPQDPAAAAFVAEEFGLEPLDLRRCLDLVLQAVRAGSYGLDDGQRQAIHDFARAVFRKDRAVLQDHSFRGLTPVPVRAWRRGRASGWRAAENTYFSRDWTGCADLEHLYRRFGEREFLAVSPPKEPRRLSELRAFYHALGVASEPRQCVHTGRMWEAPAGWRHSEEVTAAEYCPDDHPQTDRQFEYDLLDRLRELLEGIRPAEAHALANVLAKERDPYGSKAKIWCLHSAHRSAVTRRAIGFQQWLLLRHSWIPVQGDPLGRALVRPTEAWANVNGRALRACLARADIPKNAFEKLRLPSATRPGSCAIVEALTTLRTAYPELSSAPAEVAEGCLHLLRKLEAAIARENLRPGELARPLLPAFRGGSLTWTDRPAVPDTPVPPELPIEVLPDGDWSALAETFDLPRVSGQVDISTEPIDAAEAEIAGLGPEERVHLTALLAARGEDLKSIAHQLGRLRTMGCSEIRTRYTLDDYTVVDDLQVCLTVEDGRPGNLFVVEPLSEAGRAELASLLADHLGVSKQQDAVRLSIFQVPGLLRAFGIGDAALDEAREALSRYVASEEPDDHVASGHMDSGSRAGDPERPEGLNGPNHPGTTNGLQADGHPPQVGTAHFDGRQSGFNSESQTLKRSDGAVVFHPFRGGSSSPRPSGSRPSGAQDGTGQSGYTTVSSESRRSVEVEAIKVAIQYGQEELHCRDVKDVQEANKGWDLEFVFADEWWPIEVKGFGAAASAFILTKNELAAAKTQREYRVLLVTGVQRGTGELLELRDLEAWLNEGDMEAMSWAVRDWQGAPSTRKGWTRPQASEGD